MTAQQYVRGSELLFDAYHLTLTGIDDDVVREELKRLCRYETSDDQTYRISYGELMRMRTAMAQRHEERRHQGGALWSERRVHINTPTDAEGFFDDTTREI